MKMLPGGKAGPPSATQGVGRDCRHLLVLDLSRRYIL